MKFSLVPMNEDSARAICSWRYPEPYSVYDGNPADVAYMLDPRCHYFAVIDEVGDLAGFFCFGIDAQVPGELDEDERNTPDVLDVGLGMRPDLTGRGYGLDFVMTGLAVAREAFAPAQFRLAVLTFNRRAIRVYEKAGFRPVRTFVTETDRGVCEFLKMIRDERPSVSA